MKTRFVLLLLLLPVWASAQTDEITRAALYLTGADDPAQLDERLLEELESFRSRPLPLNRSSRARLLESGLLSRYQIAALEEYRSLSGDVLSFAELELVDGFGKEAVDILRPFLSLDSGRNPGAAADDSLRWKQSALLRLTGKDAGGKYRLSAGRFEGAGALKGESGTAYALWRTRRGKIVVGDYNVRYGQGLAFWSAFQLAGLYTPEAFSKRANGITPSWSFSGTGTVRGAAWDGTAGPFQLAVFGGLDGTLGGHALWMGRSGEAGITLSRESLSMEGRWNHRGKDLFAEMALKGRSPAFLAGCLSPLGDRFRCAFQLRSIPTGYSGRKNGEYALASGLGFRSDDRSLSLSWTVDAALLPVPGTDPGRWQIKSFGVFSYKASEKWQWDSRVSVRLRSYEDSRSDVRVDATWTRRSWSIRNRFNVVRCGHWAFLTYAEGGWKPDGACAYLRLTLFSTRDWQGRIYCYERDAPGNFTVPAYSGTGVSVSAYGGWKKRFGRTTLKAYLRAAATWKKEKPGQTGLKFQLMVER